MPKRSNSKTGKVYTFVHRRDEFLRTNILGINYEHPQGYITIKPNGLIEINVSCFGDGYAWDGCTPKYEFLDLIFGTPDGRLDYLTEKPIAYYASFVHDIFYQFKKDVPLSRKTTDLLFCKILKEAGFNWWWLYYFCVRVAGTFFGNWKNKTTVKDLVIDECSWITYALEQLKEKQAP